jgi:hypothetical protein
MPRVLGLRFALVLTVSLSSSALALANGFIENRGQTDDAVRYYTLGSRAAVYFTADAVVFDLKEAVPPGGKSPTRFHRDPEKRMEPEEPLPRRGCAVFVRFEGANPSPVIEARSKLETQYNYFLGNDPSQWRTEVPAYTEVVYHDLWPGVDLVYRDDGGRLTYEVIASGEGDPENVRFSFEGAERVVPLDDGSYRIETPFGSFIDARCGPGSRIRALALVGEANEPATGPEGSSERDNPSALLWSTFLGGSDWDEGLALALDSSGNPVLTGYTFSSDFPTTPGTYDGSWNVSWDAFVAKLSSSGSSLLWSTFLGGTNSDDAGWAMALDSLGNPVLMGWTYSFTDISDFPTTPGAYDQTFNGYLDVFVSKLSSSGSSLLWSTFLGGHDEEQGYGLVLDPSGNSVVTGSTWSSNFPTTPGAYDRSFNGWEDVFVSKLSSSGSSLMWSTFLGGNDEEQGYGLALDPSGNPVVTGSTQSSNFPTTPGAYDRSLNGEKDVFVSKLSSSGSSLLWSTFLGGSSADFGYALALGPSGNAVLTGSTASSDFPTTPGAYDTSFDGFKDVFVAKLSSTGSSLLWSTFFGGSAGETGYALALDPSGNPVLTGCTGSDVFVAKLSGTGRTLLWSTFLGGSSADFGYALALDPTGNPVLAGVTYSSDFPTTQGAYDTSPNGFFDVFVTKLSRLSKWSVMEARGPAQAKTPGQLVSLVITPNPFNPVTTIQFLVPVAGPVSLTVHDITGRRVATIAEGVHQPGDFTAVWNGKDDAGMDVPSGIYFARLHAEDFTATRKMVMFR